jgi:hypothetical protein
MPVYPGALASLYEPALTPPVAKPIPDTEPQVTALIQSLLKKIAAGNADPNDFGPEYRKAMFPDDIKNLAEGLKSLGPLKSLELLDHKEEDHLRSYTYRGLLGENPYKITFSLDADNRVTAMNIRAE